jgi:hypothetical protein
VRRTSRPIEIGFDDQLARSEETQRGGQRRLIVAAQQRAAPPLGWRPEAVGSARNIATLRAGFGLVAIEESRNVPEVVASPQVSREVSKESRAVVFRAQPVVEQDHHAVVVDVS